MLNGKFYTGLPPKMMERNTGAQNRLESHLFWPDDSKTESAIDTRLKRRTSFQAEQPTSRDGDIQRQTSWSGAENGIDTKQRFNKEFAKSSIQFYDNLQEEEIDSAGRHAIRKPLIRRHLKQDIAIKPTAMNMKLPNNDAAQEEYAAIKKSQAFDSKIQFYDYADHNGRQRNNNIRPKMDMNDKKDVERNTKNSPKLQVKGNIRLLEHEQRNNERNQNDVDFTQERNYGNYEDDELPIRRDGRVLHSELRDERRTGNDRFRSERDRKLRYDSPIRRQRNKYDDRYNDDMDDISQQEYNDGRATSRSQSTPKRILKNPVRDERVLEDLRSIYDDLEYVERNTRNMRIRTSPKKHVTYGDEIYENELQNGNHYSDDAISYRRPQETMESGRTARAVKYNSRNEMKSRNRSAAGNSQRQQQNRPIRSNYEENFATNDEERGSSDRTEGNSSSKNPLNMNKNNNNSNNNNNYYNNATKLNNLSHQQQQQQQRRKITPKISTSSMPNNDSSTSPPSPTMDSQKHLRSSLCFSDGEIVANNLTEAGSGTPTSESSSRRTARSAATTRRVCVGLPD